MKKNLLLLCSITMFGVSSWGQVAQFPQVYNNDMGASNASNLNIRQAPGQSANILISSGFGIQSKIGAVAMGTSSSDPNFYNWVQVCLPSTTGSLSYGYIACDELYARIDPTNNYATVNVTTFLNIRSAPGTGSSIVTINGSSASYGRNSIVALTGSTSIVSGVTWYQVYLTTNCSQLAGWLSGQFLTINGTTSNYRTVGGRVCNDVSNCNSLGNLNGATINMSGIGSTHSSGGFYEYKLPINYSTTITCTHSNYNTSTPSSYSYTANGHNYTRNFVLSNAPSCTNSTAPTAAIATPASITSGNSSTLSVSGGSLGSCASWQWYSESCGGTFVGTGTGANGSITVSPTSTTTYFVRAEGGNTTICRSVTVTVTSSCTNSTAPTAAIASPTSITSGNSSTLSVSGGSLGSCASWLWYSESCGGTFVGTGTGANGSITVSPTSTTTYFVRAEGGNTTICRSVTATVTSSCTAPTTQANTINFSGISTNQMTVNWVNGNGTNRIVVAKASSSITGTPSNGIIYTENSSFGSGSTLNSEEYVVYNGTGTGVTITNLSANTTYYFRVYEYSCIPTQYLTTSAAGNPNIQITTAIPTPSQVTINNVISNNSTFPVSKQLWTGYTNQPASTIKICADASKATEITFINSTGINSNNIRFWISSDPNGNNSDISGYFILTDYSVSGNTIKAKFTHPKYLQSIYKPSRSDAIQIVDYTNPTPEIFSIPIEIYRAPVIMVHGLWGDQFTFTDIETTLDASNYYPNILTYRVDYYFTNSRSFTTNAFVIPTNINAALAYARNNNYSAGKVDIVAHSMGGILARNYLQSSSYQLKQDIHKIITLNTPHSGSQAANFLMNQSTCESNAARSAVNFWLYQFGNYGSSVDDGAVHDLAINSSAMNSLNSTYLNNGIVPCHSIVTETQPSFGIAWGYAMMNSIAGCCNIFNTKVCSSNSFLDYLFYDNANDLIVAVQSQEGGLPSAAITPFYNQMHLGAAENPAIITEVVNALNINSSNSNYFAQNGYSPVNFSSHYRLPETDTPANRLQNESLNITYPASGQSFNPGEIIPVNVSSNNGINRVILEGLSSQTNIYVKDTVLTNGIIRYSIPADAFGKVGIIVLGFDAASGFIDFDTVTVSINITSTLDSITAYTDTILVQVNNTAPIELTGYFSNGFSYNIANSSDMQYQVADTNIAKYISSNRIKGKQVGMTTLSATYLEQTKTFTVIVIPQDTTNILVNPIPTINTEGQTTFCVGEAITLTASIGISYLWSNGSTAQSIIVNSTGSYTVTVTNSFGYSATSTAINVTVNPLPTATITPGGTTTFCQGNSVTLTASEANSYLWSNGTTTQNNIVSSAGNYSVTVMDGNGCSATSPITTVTDNSLLTAAITPGGTTTFCQGNSVTLTASEANSYLWSDGTTTQNNTVLNSGDYSVTITDGNGCSATSPTMTVTVNPLPTATITPDGSTNLCEGNSVTLTASAASSYLWSDGTTTQNIAVSNTGNYSVTVTDGNGCSATSTITPITVNPLPTATIIPGSTTNLCEGNSVTLTASEASSYLWSNGATTQNNTVSTSGNYSVTITDGNGCSASSSTTNVIVNPTVVPTIKIQQTSCNSNIVNFNSNITSGGSNPSYLWTVTGSTQTGTEPTFTVVNATTGMQVKCTLISNETCAGPTQVSSTSLTITIPDVSISGELSFCQNTFTILKATGAATYQWNNGLTSPSIIIRSPGTYSVKGISSTGCADTASVQISMLSIPVINLDANVKIDRGTNTTLGHIPVATGAMPFSYEWIPSTGLDSDSSANPVASPRLSTTYTLKVTDKNGCSNTKSIEVLVKGFYVFPNPSSDIVNIYGSDIENGKYVIRLRNKLEQIVLSEEVQITSGSLNKQISISKFSSGIYFLSIESVGKKPSVFKITKL